MKLLNQRTLDIPNPTDSSVCTASKTGIDTFAVYVLACEGKGVRSRLTVRQLSFLEAALDDFCARFKALSLAVVKTSRSFVPAPW